MKEAVLFPDPGGPRQQAAYHTAQCAPRALAQRQLVLQREGTDGAGGVGAE